MNDSRLQLALREWRRHMGRTKLLAALLGVGAILGVSGPFGTADVLPFAPRMLYWVVVAYTTYATGALLAVLTAPALDRLPKWPGAAAFGVINGIAVTCVVAALNLAAFGGPTRLVSVLELFGGVLVISIILSFLSTLFGAEARPRQEPTQSAAPPILTRLPYAKRGRLVALSGEDHYVRVQTDKGDEMVLMRLADAMREVGGMPGAQVHRSHWVAFEAVAGARRQGDRAILTLTTGAEIPVSRSNLPKVRAAGLLPA